MLQGYVYDYADARPTQQQLSAGQSQGSSRYIKLILPNDYDLDSDERTKLMSWGEALLYNAEQNADDVTNKPPSYFASYGSYTRDRLLAFGVTPGRINVPLSADTGLSSKQIPGVMNNYSAFAAAVEPFGVVGYAQIDIIDLLHDEGISPPTAKHWLPGAIGWSGYDNTPDGWNAYITHPHAGLVQLGPDAVGWWDGTRFRYDAPGAPTVPGTDTNLAFDMAAAGFDFPPGHPYAPKEDPMIDGFLAFDTHSSVGYHVVGGVKIPQNAVSFTQLADAGVPRLDLDPAALNGYPLAGALETEILQAIQAITSGAPSGPAIFPPFTFSGTATPEATA